MDSTTKLFSENLKSYTLPSSSSSPITYRYVHIPPSTSSTTNSTKPTVLLVHGFPSSAYDWRHQIAFLTSHGYGIIAPDLLGYGGTSKPLSPSEYRLKKMSGEVIALLDHILQTSTTKVHGVAHDFGSHLLGRLANYYPDRWLSITFMAVAPLPPGFKFNLDFMKKVTDQVIGFEKFGYMRFMAREDSGKVLDERAERFFGMIYSEDEDVALRWFFPEGRLEAYLTGETEGGVEREGLCPPWITPHEKSFRNDIFFPSPSSSSPTLEPYGYQAPTNWYRGLVHNLNFEDESTTITNPSIKCPVLAIEELPGGKTNMPGYMEGAVKPFAKDFRLRSVSTSGHWVQLEAKDEVNAFLGEFLGEVDGGGV